MWLKVPDRWDNVLWEGPLEPATEENLERVQRDWAARGIKEDVRDEIRNQLIVSIRTPDVWQLADVYPLEKMPPMLRAKQEEADFHLVRLGCSFLYYRDAVRIEWARFMVRLMPDDAGQKPVAFDQHPTQVTQEVRRNVKVTLSPTLKFMELEADVGGLEFGLEYSELQPVVTSALIDDATPSWDYEEAKGERIKGIKWMHLLVKAPKGMPSGRAVLDLNVDARWHDSPLAVLTFRERDQLEVHLTAQLWG